MTRQPDEHDWHWHNDGHDFICMKCGKVFHRHAGAVYPPEGEKCKPKELK